MKRNEEKKQSTIYTCLFWPVVALLIIITYLNQSIQCIVGWQVSQPSLYSSVYATFNCYAYWKNCDHENQLSSSFSFLFQRDVCFIFVVGGVIVIAIVVVVAAIFRKWKPTIRMRGNNINKRNNFCWSFWLSLISMCRPAGQLNNLPASWLITGPMWTLYYMCIYE